jgi:ketosteroid isomerase-like protein
MAISAQQDPVEADIDLIKRLQTAQSSRDWAAMAAAFDDDAVFELPYIGESFRGRDEIVARMRPSLERMNGLRFFDFDIRPMAEAGCYVAEFKGSAVISTTGLPYDQSISRCSVSATVASCSSASTWTRWCWAWRCSVLSGSPDGE